MEMEAANADVFGYAVEAVTITFGAVVAVALERFYKDQRIVKAQRFSTSAWHEAFYWSVLTVLVSLGLRFIVGSAVHLKGSIGQHHGPVNEFLWDILWLFIFGTFIVRAAQAKNDRNFAYRLRWFSGAAVLWGVVAILGYPHDDTSRHLAPTWLVINLVQFAASFLISGKAPPNPAPAEKPLASKEQVLRMLALAFVFAVLFIADLCHILGGSFWGCIFGGPLCPD